MNAAPAPRLAACLRVLRALGLVACVAALAGCSSPAVVSGQVIYRKEVLTTGEVSLVAADGKSRSGLIGTDGKYEITDAPLGPVRVVVTATRAEVKAGKVTPLSASAPSPPVPVRSLVPLKYRDPATSGLTYLVTPGRQTNVIELED
jgi:hypothetical protein